MSTKMFLAVLPNPGTLTLWSNASMSIYCVYLTIYKGNKLPPFYIGSSSVEKVNRGYHGSVSSKKYKSIWLNELVEHPELFSTKILATYLTRKEALDKEHKLQLIVNAPINSMYINEAYAKKGFAYGIKQSPEHISKRTSHRKGGQGTRNGAKLSDDHREKFTFKGRKHTDTAKEKNRLAHMGKIDTPETRQKRSDSAKGKPKPWLQGKPKSQEVIQIQNEGRRKNRETWSEEKKQNNSNKISNSLKGKPKTYTTNCAKKFVCRLSDKKEFSKASAAKYLVDLKLYF
jgi:hypothetical protein